MGVDLRVVLLVVDTPDGDALGFPGDGGERRPCRSLLDGEHKDLENPIAAAQHIAIVLDDRIVSTPFIDFRQVPDGIDGRDGAQIQGGLTTDGARRIAAILDSGPLPATLEPVR